MSFSSSSQESPKIKVEYRTHSRYSTPQLKEHDEEVDSLARLYQIVATCFEAPDFYDLEGDKISYEDALLVFGVVSTINKMRE